MKEQLALLRELQRIDLQLDDLEEQKDEIQDKLQENRGFLDKLIDDLENQKTELEEVRDLRRRKKEDAEVTRGDLAERQDKLKKISSQKEFDALEIEIDVLKKKLEETQEEAEGLDEVIESTEQSIEEKEEKIVQLREGIASEVAEAEEQLADLDEQIEARENRQDEARGEVSRRVLHKYDFIRSRRAGLAIVPAKDGHCEGCYMAIPPQQFIEIQRGESLEICPSCQRILYYWEHALDDEDKVSNDGETAEAD